MSGTRNPEFFFFLKAFALMRRFAPVYLVAAALLLFIARPGVGAILAGGLSGLLCGALQLLAAHWGQKLLYRFLFLSLVIGLAGMVYYRIAPFELTGMQAAAIALLAVAMQRAVCGYLHRFAFGGVSFSVRE